MTWTVVCRDCRWGDTADSEHEGNLKGQEHLETAHRALAYPQGYVVHNTNPSKKGTARLLTHKPT